MEQRREGLVAEVFKTILTIYADALEIVNFINDICLK